jgi:hypothetical protein
MSRVRQSKFTGYRLVLCTDFARRSPAIASIVPTSANIPKPSCCSSKRYEFGVDRPSEAAHIEILGPSE